MDLRPSIVLLGLLLALSPVTHAVEFQRSISVAGLGEVSLPPDTALIHTGVETHAADAQSALAANNRSMARIIALLEQRGIEARDIQTSGFGVTPVYRRDAQRRDENEIAGYRTSNQLRVRLRELPRLGEVLDALVGAGSNQLSGISFEIGDPAPALEEARLRAMADARARAERYARAAGVRVGKVLTISEQSVQPPGPQHLARATMMEQASAVPVAAGEHQVRATVNVVYAIED